MMRTMRMATCAVAAMAAMATTVFVEAATKIECRHPNYLARDGKLVAVDPSDPTKETPLTLKGVTWSGMEKENMIPEGLWGADKFNSKGIKGTKVATLVEFLRNNSFNSVRLPIHAESLNKDALPQLAYIHGFENRELTGNWADPNAVRYIDLLGRVVQVFGQAQISVLLEIETLGSATEDPFWYTGSYVAIEESATYKAVEYLARSMCNATNYNILGVDLKSAMTAAEWGADSSAGDKKRDWRAAAEKIGNHLLELCPQWLVFVGGAASASPATDGVTVDKDYEPSPFWPGGNLANATKNPIKLSVANKLVFAPQAHTHGRLPQNYFFSADSNCSKKAESVFELEGDGITAECVDWVDGKKARSRLGCSSSGFGCSSYKQLSKEKLLANYKKVLEAGIGDVVKDKKTPVVFGSFSGVYNSEWQPQQTVLLEYLIDYAATNLQGGYFWALNPDTEFYVEDSIDKKAGLFGRTHYGLFQLNSWQEAYPELLEQLKKIPSTELPCYGGSGGKKTSKTYKSAVGVDPRQSSIVVAGLSVMVAMILAVL